MAEPLTPTATIASLLVADLQSGARLRAAKVAQECERTPNVDNPDPIRTTGIRRTANWLISVTTALGPGCVTGGWDHRRTNLRGLTGAHWQRTDKDGRQDLKLRPLDVEQALGRFLRLGAKAFPDLQEHHHAGMRDLASRSAIRPRLCRGSRLVKSQRGGTQASVANAITNHRCVRAGTPPGSRE